MPKILKWLVAAILAAIVAGAIYLYVAPPDLIRVATAYSAKIVCSNIFIAGRDGDEVLAVDVQAAGHPILKFISIDVDRDRQTVAADLLGLFGRGLAVHHEGAGCATVPDGDLDAAALPPVADGGEANGTATWPAGEQVDASQDPDIAAILDDTDMTGPGLRAVVVVHNGRIVGERYGEGFTAQTPLLGWSMTKTVTAAIIGTLVADGRVTVDDTGLFEAWTTDERDEIALANLMAMNSGLEFNEDYGDVTDVTRMLYLEPDMAGFAIDKPLTAQPGELFNYSSGTSVILSRAWQDLFADAEAALAWPRQALFGPLGMTSAVLEADARGTYVGSSYLYATAHDWARFGQLLLNGGVWNGTRILPEGFVEWMQTEDPASKGAYGHGNVWLHGPRGGTPEGQESDAGFDLPEDAFWLLGHDGQTVTVVPSLRLVVVRLGLTPSKMNYKPQKMIEALSATLRN